MTCPAVWRGTEQPHPAHVETLQYSGYSTAAVQPAVRYDVSYVEFLRARETLSRLHHSSGLRIIEETWVDVAFRMYLAKIAEVASAIPPPESVSGAIWEGRGCGV